MNRLKRFVTAAMLLTAVVFGGLLSGCTHDIREEIVISMPDSEYIRSIDTNYYKLWLEEQTGLSIEFNIIRDVQTPDRLRSVLASGLQTDAFFSIFGGETPEGWNRVLQEFGESGYIIPLNEYVEQSVHLNAIFERFPDYNLKDAITSPDGSIYYMPGFDPSILQSNFQVMWLNQSWLKALKRSAPTTTEELREVLLAFRDNDPNGNGLRDEIPLAGGNDVASEQCYNFIINAFVYNDPANSHLFVENGAVKFAPVTDEWREAMQYLNGLYRDGLISPFQFELGHVGLEGLTNDPKDILGGFTSRFANDVIFPGNRDVVQNYLHIAPITGPDGVRNATVRTPAPAPAGMITSSCKNPEAVFKLFDLMLSEEAFLIGRYGEENVDWVPAGSLDVDFYGETATVKVMNQLWGEMQNKHIAESGPFFAYPEYANGVTFSANDLDPQYINARAYHIYAPFRPIEYLRYLDTKDTELRQAIDACTNKYIKAFITGEKDPFDDAIWQIYVSGYAGLGIEQLTQSAQKAYDTQRSDRP